MIKNGGRALINGGYDMVEDLDYNVHLVQWHNNNNFYQISKGVL